MLWFIEMLGIFEPRVRSKSGERVKKIEFDEPAIVIANHPCLLDIVLLMGALREGVVVVKPWVYFNPLLGGLAWCCGYIRGGDGLAAGMSVIQQAVQRLEEGSVVVLFPEGTRSTKNGLHPFRRGAFRIARMTGAPIAPFHIHCDPPVLGKGQPLGDFPGDRSVRFVAQKLWHEVPDIHVRDEKRSARQLEQSYRDMLSANLS